ncbi:NAD(P)H-quinone oxidoreductase subunit F [Leptolyngbya sp. 'hensonii']|uniref:NAD(P)H-quinone oxidoreductase subunit F n=1 Tax=Leptolyngbya sp. 'hensonii' TaxID=1922337 RepID=UPI00094F9BBC|nr:NAD(P)H-quinone oxidoreductase subunit F [Leptolyngbya sp. 'hensonii']OLP16191.1 NAD(P)H-quinone oxidoreductase subunit F [Leptolyngbya sp. 'hensonii']
MAQLLLQTIWLIPCYALLGTVLSVLWFPSMIRRTGPRPAGYVNLLMTCLALLHSVLSLSAIWGQPAQEFLLPWLQVANLDLTLPILLSPTTVGACVVITGINLLAQVYAVGYMEMDWGWARFYSLLALFEAGMCTLALCNSLFFSYIVLEILTLGTYLLVGFWFNQSLVVTGARDAFLTKRVGDLFLLMGVIALLPLAGTWNFTELADWSQTAQVDPTVMALVSLALIAGPMGKCAQFPLHLWLDEAMEGPLPSTILRNSVVVATGAWVLIKLQPVLALSPIAMVALIFIGGLTAVGASLIAIAQIDIKRTLSYAVSAYMGLVFIAVGTQQTEAAFLLTLTHALAMSLLVMSIGSIIWNSVTQDLTQLGGLWSRRPISGLAFLTGLAGLVAFPPLGSFWALLKLADGLWSTQPWLVGLLLFVNGMTAFSLTRVFSLVFGGQAKQMAQRSPEIHWPMAFPMVVLLGFTLHLPLVLQAFDLLPHWATLNTDVALLLIWSTLSGISIGGVVYLGTAVPKPVQLPWVALQELLAYDFYTARFYRLSIVFAVDLVSRLTAWFDRYIVDGLVNLFGLVTLLSGQSLKYSTSGQGQFYILTILLGIGLVAVLVFTF